MVNASPRFPHVSQKDVDRWDLEWMHYFSTESRYQHLVEARDLEVIFDLSGKKPETVFNASLTQDTAGNTIVPLRVWIDGDRLLGKAVVEIGCGCGWLGKQLGLVSERYLGVDYSQFALAVARGTSPSTCTYVHISKQDELKAQEGRFDTMVGREFFIHQNFENANWVLGMGAFFLKAGGVISADFYEPDPNVEQGVVHPAMAPLDARYASCAFRFRMDEIEKLATTNGLDVQDVTDYRPHQRRFVSFVKR